MVRTALLGGLGGAASNRCQEHWQATCRSFLPAPERTSASPALLGGRTLLAVAGTKPPPRRPLITVMHFRLNLFRLNKDVPVFTAEKGVGRRAELKVILSTFTA